MPSLVETVAEKWRNLPIVPTKESCSGATYIVTGSNTGLGLEAARHLARFGAAKLILAVRNARAGEAAKVNIEATNQTSSVIEVWPLDLSSFQSVKAFAQRAMDELDRIDAIIENAGVALDTFKLVEGHESTITVNVLSTLLLAILMLPKMMESAKKFGIVPHIAIIGSGIAFDPGAKVELDKLREDPLRNMDREDLANMNIRYPFSKLVLLLAFRQLASTVPVDRTGVVINIVNPGLCQTSLNRNTGFMARMQINIAMLLVGRTAEMGSRTLLHGAVAGKESHGCYLSACQIKEQHIPSWLTENQGQQIQERVWQDVAEEHISVVIFRVVAEFCDDAIIYPRAAGVVCHV